MSRDRANYAATRNRLTKQLTGTQLDHASAVQKYKNQYKRRHQINTKDGKKWVDWDTRTGKKWDSSVANKWANKKVYKTATPYKDLKYLDQEHNLRNLKNRYDNDAFAKIRRQFSPKTTKEGQRVIDVKREETIRKKTDELQQSRAKSSYARQPMKTWKESTSTEPTVKNEKVNKKENGGNEEKPSEIDKLRQQVEKQRKRINELTKNGGTATNEGVPPDEKNNKRRYRSGVINTDEPKPKTPVETRTSHGRKLDEIPGWDPSTGQINRGPINAFGLEIPQQPISPLIDVSKADALRGRLQDIQTQGQANRLRRSSQFYQRGGGARALDMHMRNLPQLPQLQGQANATNSTVTNLANPTNYLRPPVNFTRSPVLQNTWDWKFGNSPSPGVEVFRGNVVPPLGENIG